MEYENREKELIRKIEDLERMFNEMRLDNAISEIGRLQKEYGTIAEEIHQRIKTERNHIYQVILEEFPEKKEAI